jgi:hypothetical protein
LSTSLGIPDLRGKLSTASDLRMKLRIFPTMLLETTEGAGLGHEPITSVFLLDRIVWWPLVDWTFELFQDIFGTFEFGLVLLLGVVPPLQWQSHRRIC